MSTNLDKIIVSFLSVAIGTVTYGVRKVNSVTSADCFIGFFHCQRATELFFFGKPCFGFRYYPEKVTHLYSGASFIVDM